MVQNIGIKYPSFPALASGVASHVLEVPGESRGVDEKALGLFLKAIRNTCCALGQFEYPAAPAGPSFWRNLPETPDPSLLKLWMPPLDPLLAGALMSEGDRHESGGWMEIGISGDPRRAAFLSIALKWSVYGDFFYLDMDIGMQSWCTDGPRPDPSIRSLALHRLWQPRTLESQRENIEVSIVQSAEGVVARTGEFGGRLEHTPGFKNTAFAFRRIVADQMPEEMPFLHFSPLRGGQDGSPAIDQDMLSDFGAEVVFKGWTSHPPDAYRLLRECHAATWPHLGPLFQGD